MKNNKKSYIVGLISIAFMFSLWGGGSAYGQEVLPLLDHVEVAKVAGDRFSIYDFNDIWEFIKRVFIGTNDRVGISAWPREEIAGTNVTFDLGHQADELGDPIDGVLAVDAICSDTQCSPTDDILNIAAGSEGVGQFVGVTDATTYTTLNGAGTTSSLDSAGKTKGRITYDTLVGYVAANAICKAAFDSVSAHICTEDEVVLTIDSNIDAFVSFTSETFGWVSGGGSKYTSGLPVDDCGGFTYDAGGDHVGNIWKLQSTGGAGSAQPCVTPTRIACCI